MKKFILLASALMSVGLSNAQEKVRVHNGAESYVTTIEYVTFDVTNSDEAVSVSDLTKSNSTLNSQVSTLTSENKNLSTQVTSLTSEKNSLSTQVSSLTSENKSLSTQVTSLTSEKNSLSTQVSTLTNENKTLSTQVGTLTNQLNKVSDEKYEYFLQVNNLNKENNSLKTEVSDLTKDNNNLSAQVKSLTTDKSNLSAQLANLQVDKTNLLSTFTNGHDFVDLGLPSKTLWATRNVGTSTGDYFQWGETVARSTCGWEKYAHGKGSEALIKYCTNKLYGVVDNKTELEVSDDAATAKWGSMWKIPSKVEWDELLKYCTLRWVERYEGGANGILVTGPNGKTIFLPAVGYKVGSSIEQIGQLGYYASSTLWTNCSYSTQYTVSSSSGGKINCSGVLRSVGLLVRPVLRKF